MSGGRITFHSKLTVPKPSGRKNGDADVTTVIDPVVEAAAARLPGPVSTETSYLDPNGIDVYGEG
jgi:hypothetical protein